VACDGRQSAVEGPIDGFRRFPFPEIVGHGGEQRVEIGVLEKRGHRLDRQRSPSEGFQLEPQLLHLILSAVQVRAPRGRKIHRAWDQEGLPGDPPFPRLSAEALEHDTLMRRVLIDEKQPVRRLEDQIGLVGR
jgi:hypothetical protein